MKKILLSLALFALVATARAQYVTATITVTNLPSDGDTIVLNGNTRTFKTTVTTPGTQITIGGSANATATNLYQEVAANPIAGTIWTFTTTNAITLQGTAATATKTGTWGTIGIVSTPTTNLTAFMLPAANLRGDVATNEASQAITALALSTNALDQTATAASQLAGLGNAQTITGQKVFSGANTYSNPAQKVIGGSVSNVTAYNLNLQTNGDVAGVSNITIFTFGSDPGAAYNGTPFRMFYNSTNAGVSFDDGVPGMYIPFSGIVAAADLQTSYMLLNGGIVTNYKSIFSTTSELLSSTNFYITNGLMIFNGSLLLAGASTNTSLTGHTTTTGTNTIGGVIAFSRFNNSAMSGINQDINLGTNVYVKLSGSSGASTNAGFVAGQNGEFHIIELQAGFNVTMVDDSGYESTPANRIYTPKRADMTLTNALNLIEVIYDSSVSRWKMITPTSP